MDNKISQNVKFKSKYSIGNNVIIESDVSFGDNIEIGNNVIIYKGTKFGDNIRILDNAVIGKQPVAPFVEHDSFKISKMPPTELGSNVVIGTSSILYAGSMIGGYFYSADRIIVREACKIKDHVTLGKDSIIEHHVTVGEYTKVQSKALVGEGMVIEDHVFIGPFFNGACDKFMDRIEERVFEPPTIKAYSRIGAHVVLVAGVSIGKDSVIGAGAVVTKDIPDYSVAVGVPAKVIKKNADLMSKG